MIGNQENRYWLRFTCRGHFNTTVFWGKKRVDLWSCTSKHKCFSVKKAGSLAEAISTQVFISSTSSSCAESRFREALTSRDYEKKVDISILKRRR